ncbi:MAG: sugar phosphate isomerase/epimerase family protein [Lentisphaerota bacterium]
MKSHKISATWAGGFGRRPLPYLYSGDPAAAFAQIAANGYDAVELLLSDNDYLSSRTLQSLLERNNLALSAIGTGGAAISHSLFLSSPVATIRDQAEGYIRGIIELAGRFGAGTILGSVIGTSAKDETREQALSRIIPVIERLSEHAAAHGSLLLIEPLNRYESNLLNCIGQGLELIARVGSSGVKLLADCFHMNIEEQSIGDSILKAAGMIGHVHLSDSNRCAPGLGHINYAPVSEALSAIHFKGFVSMEVSPIPCPDAAAKQAISTYRRFF